MQQILIVTITFCKQINFFLPQYLVWWGQTVWWAGNFGCASETLQPIEQYISPKCSSKTIIHPWLWWKKLQDLDKGFQLVNSDVGNTMLKVNIMLNMWHVPWNQWTGTTNSYYKYEESNLWISRSNETYSNEISRGVTPAHYLTIFIM